MANIPPIRFINSTSSEFYETLKTRVNEYFAQKQLSRHANAEMYLKSFLLLSGYLLPFLYLIFASPSGTLFYFLWLVMGVALAGIGMSVMHDANHGAYSSNKMVNYIMGHTLNLLGGSVFNWKLQHNFLHHTYTNIVHWDEDIKNKMALRFNPDGTAKPFHRFQYIYAFFMYGLMTLYWVFGKDFFQFYRYTANGVNKQNDSKNNYTILKITLAKIFYVLIILVLPYIFFGVPFFPWLMGFLLMHFVGGLVLTVIFQLAHTVEETSHPTPNEKDTIQNAWAIHQMNTTVNFSQNNKLLSWYVGGLNFQIEHHLFPTICHVHYPAIASIVKNTASEFGIPYLENPTFSGAIKSHLLALKRFGTVHISEAIN